MSYVYARGTERAVFDAARNAKSFGKITYDPSTHKTVFEKTSSKLVIGSIQGSKPLSGEVFKTLAIGKDVETILLMVKSRSEISPADKIKIITYYKVWKSTEGVIYQEIGGDYTEFDRWLSK